jgi:multidrug efflux system membrane fusion protein
MRRFFSLGLALLIVLGLGVWLGTGTLVIGGRGPGNGEMSVAEALDGHKDGPVNSALENAGLLKAEVHEEGPDPALTIAERQEAANGADTPPQSVRIITSTLKPLQLDVPLRGLTKAKSIVTIVPETSGTVEKVLVSKGQKVNQGDLLCTLDQGTRAAAVAQAQAAVLQANAALSAAQTAFDANKELRDKGLAAANSGQPLESQLSAAQAGIAAAQSGLDNAKAELDRTDIVASVSGVIQDPLATVGSMLGPQAPCATIVQLDPMLFVGAVPEARIALAKEGLAATITTVTGDSVAGKVSYISSTADPATRSFQIEIEIPNADGRVRDGITAEATVNVGTAPAHLLPQSVMTLNDDGVLGVRVVEDSKVAFYPITILKDTREGVWVTGLPATSDVISVGQESVIEGQTVNAQHAPDEPATTQGTQL